MSENSYGLQTIKYINPKAGMRATNLLLCTLLMAVGCEKRAVSVATPTSKPTTTTQTFQLELFYRDGHSAVVQLAYDDKAATTATMRRLLTDIWCATDAPKLMRWGLNGSFPLQDSVAGRVPETGDRILVQGALLFHSEYCLAAPTNEVSFYCIKTRRAGSTQPWRTLNQSTDPELQIDQAVDFLWKDLVETQKIVRELRAGQSS